jgi:hypothetical protein
MNKNSEKLDDQIDRFLQAEEDGLKPRFSNANLAREIFSKNHSDKGRNLLILFSLVGLAACLVFAFLSHFIPPSGSSDSLTQRSQVQTAELLLDSDKELLEDLLAMPQEMNWGEALPDESTFDLLVMLDQPFE